MNNHLLGNKQASGHCDILKQLDVSILNELFKLIMFS